MADNQAAVAEQQDEIFEYPIRVEDAGPATKKVIVVIPRRRIAEELEKQFGDLKRQAQIPGFRPGRAPRALIEKRFEQDVKDQVRRALISESYEQAVERNKLQVIGEPEFDDPEKLTLPDEGDFSYSFQVEVAPDITLPDLSELTVKKPRVQVTEENINQAMQNLREQQGTLVPVEDRGAQAGDYLVADVHLKLGEEVITHQHDAQLVLRPARLAGIQIEDLADRLKDIKPGETRIIEVQAPEQHFNERIRSQLVKIEIAVKELKRLELAEITPEFLQDLGFENEQALRDALAEQLQERISADVQQVMRQQVEQFLLERINIELPSKLSDRQEQRVINRRVVDLMMRGLSREQVEANLEKLKGGAREEALRELKLFFILQKVAADHNVDVDEQELNGQIAMIAVQQGRRPEKVKQEMAADGSLQNLYVRLRERKAIDKIMEKVRIEEVEPEKTS